MQLEQHSPDDQAHCIDLTDVSFSYGREDVLQHITFSIERGDYVGMIGPNGGGKTTLLKMILGLLRPTHGRVRVFGQDVYRLSYERAHIGYVPQRASQLDSTFPASVEEVVASGRTARLGIFHVARSNDQKAIARALDITGLTSYRQRLIGELSGGERQRVYIARALAGEPQVLILDEPTVGVDLTSQDQFFSFLSDLNKQHGLTILLVSHDIDSVRKEVKTLLCINRELICAGPAATLITHEYLERLYGKNIHLAAHGH